MRRFIPIVKTMAEPKFLTLTLKRRPLCRENVKFLRDCFTKLRHRKIWTARGGVYQIEIGTVDELGQCNLHIHAAIDSPYMSQKSLSKVWKEITGDSFIVDIRKAKDARDIVWYMSKHLAKMPGPMIWGHMKWQHKLINDVLKGTRLVQGFGTLCHVSMPLGGCTCPKCGSVDSFTLIRSWEPTHDGL